jgi:predicted ester cyclase
VWVRLTYTGIHTGEYLGFAPTGKKITSRAVDLYRIVNGKMVEISRVEQLDFLKTLGVIEYTEKGKKLFPDSS